MPLFSEHISNMYYSGSPSYSNPYSSYSSSLSPLGTSYSASYLNPGGSYSSHSSLGGYSRAPLTSRWIPGLSRNYSPMLTPISERGTSSPVRINSPRRIPITKRSYGTSGYTQRPININTSDIDVSRDKYRRKSVELAAPVPKPPPQKELFSDEKQKSPFMPRVDGKPETGIDSSPGLQRNTIKRGRTVVRLHTVKRKERDSPRKPIEIVEPPDKIQKATVENAVEIPENKIDTEASDSKSWRERLSEDLTYNDKKEKKSLGTKFVETFIVKDSSDQENDLEKNNLRTESISKNLPANMVPNSELPTGIKLTDRRCSMELLAEQASVLDSLIRSENLSTATLDLSKVGVTEESKTNIESIKGKKSINRENPLKTTKSDQSLHENLKSLKNKKDSKTISKRRSLKKSSSGGSIFRLDSITELPKEPVQSDLPAIEESRTSIKLIKTEEKPKPKLKAKITSSVEISPPTSPLKFRIENVTVEEKVNLPKKEITFTSAIEDTSTQEITLLSPLRRTKERHSIKKKIKKNGDPVSPEPDDGNFWNKIGKRETVYLMKRKQNLDELKEKDKRALFWFPEDENAEFTDTSENIEVAKNDITNEISSTSIPSLRDSNLTQLQDGDGRNQEISTQLSDSESNKATNETIVQKPLQPSILTQIENTQPTSKTELKFSVCENLESQNVLKNSDVTNNNLNEASVNLDEKKQREIISQLIVESNEKLASLKSSELKSNVIDTQNESTPEPKVSNSKTNKIVPDGIEEVTKNDFKETHLKSKSQGEKTKETNFSGFTEESKVKSVSKEKEAPSRKVETKLVVIDKKDSLKCNVSASARDNTTKILDNDDLACTAKKNVFDIPMEIKENSQKVITSSQKEHEFKENLKPLTDDESKINVSNVQRETEIKQIVNESEKQNTKRGSENGDESDTTRNNLKGIKVTEETKEITSQTKAMSNENKQEKDTSLKNTVKTTNKATSSSDKLQEKSEYTEETGNAKLHSLGKQDAVIDTKTNIPIDKNDTSIARKIKSSPKAEQKVLNINTEVKTEAESLGAKFKDTKGVQKCPIHSVENKTDNISNIDTKIKGHPTTALLQSKVPAEINSNLPKLLDTSVNTELRPKPSTANSENTILSNNTTTPQIPIVIQSENIPKPVILSDLGKVETEKETEEAKAETKFEEQTNEMKKLSVKANEPSLALSPKKPIKEERANKPLIATPRPLQKRSAQTIHSSESSDSSSDDESSDDEEESDTSEGSNEFFECESNVDGRVSTGSNDSGFDSSAPTSPASFMQIKKGADSPGTSSSNTASQLPATDILEQELEQSTAYGLFRKTGRFTPPARSIPRFRKYTVEDFQFIKVLGKGSFGKVLLAELRDTEYYYAVKCLKKDVVLEDDDVECTLIERKVLALGTNHPYLCHLFATFQTDSHLFFVMEYLNGGDLMFHIQQSGRFPEARARFYAAEIVSGLKFLHKRGIVYRDLKLDNILLDFDGHVRIADFGMCKLQIYLDKTADTFCGTPDYMAPEIIKGLKYSQTVDWWSFGVLLYEMLIGQSPFSGCDEDELFWSICNEMPSYPRFLSQEALTILTRLLDKDAKSRLGGVECMHGDIREQDFFHQIHWDRLERRELEAPFRPRVRHPLDTQYFDRAFTGERPRLTAVEPHVLRSMDQEPFRGFSYTNPNATDR